MRAQADDWVTPSEIGNYCYCSVAYHLTKVQKIALEKRSRDRLKKGTRRHHVHGVVYDVQRHAYKIARYLLAAAACATLVWWWLLR